MWSMTPTSSLFPFASPSHTSRNSRWTLGGTSSLFSFFNFCQYASPARKVYSRADSPASDIMFTNPVFSRFFGAGQVIETVRGGGVFQPAIDKAVKLLQDGEWVSLPMQISSL